MRNHAWSFRNTNRYFLCETRRFSTGSIVSRLQIVNQFPESKTNILNRSSRRPQRRRAHRNANQRGSLCDSRLFNFFLCDLLFNLFIRWVAGDTSLDFDILRVAMLLIDVDDAACQVRDPAMPRANVAAQQQTRKLETAAESNSAARHEESLFECRTTRPHPKSCCESGRLDEGSPCRYLIPTPIARFVGSRGKIQIPGTCQSKSAGQAI